MGVEVNLPIYLLEAVGKSLVESILLIESREKHGLLSFDGNSMSWIGYSTTKEDNSELILL